MNPPQYLNVDLVITSKVDLTHLSESFGDSVLVLGHNWANGECRAVLELSDAAHDVTVDIEKFCLLIEALNSPARETWQSAESRVLDFGFRSGEDGQPEFIFIPSDLAKRASSLGCAIGITVYPVELAPIDWEQQP